MRSHKILITNLTILALLALVVSACQSAATAVPTPTPTVMAAPPPTPVTYPQPYPIETVDPYMAPAEAYPAVDPGLSAPLTQEQGASLYPGIQDGAEVMWNQAAAMIMNGEVAQVMQTHDLKVYLTLKDGRTLFAFEPAIDEVMRVIQYCGDPCKEILVATE